MVNLLSDLPGFTAVLPRVVQSLNDAWRFHTSPAYEANAPGYDDSAWRLVDVPITAARLFARLRLTCPHFFRKKTTCSAIILLSVLASLPAASFTLNPVIQTMYTARSGIGHRCNATGRAAPLGAVTF